LNESARGDVLELWSAASVNDPCRVHVTAEFVDEKDQENDPELWHDDFYEYLINHEVIIESYKGPHICTAEPEARAAAKAGFIPADFTCPIENQDCLMRGILEPAQGKSVRLRISFEKRGISEL
jgi:hypothetical protein